MSVIDKPFSNYVTNLRLIVEMEPLLWFNLVKKMRDVEAALMQQSLLA